MVSRAPLSGLLLSGVLLLPASAMGRGDLPALKRQATLFVLDLQGTALDEMPDAIKAVNGTMTVVDKDGRHMLKASSPSEFLITLPQALPAEFTIQLDVIPKGCCAPDDITLEGTPVRNRGVASAELTWHPERISAVGGGGEMYQSAMPADLAASTPGTLTQVVVVVQGAVIKLYINGRRLFTLEKQFARGRVLRVGLGGADDGENAVYLAGLSIMSGVVAPGVVASNAQQLQANMSPTSGAGGGITAVGGGSKAPATPVAPAPAPPPVVAAPRDITPAVLNGPVPARSGSSGAGGTGTSGSTTLPARTISLAGFSATGAPVSLAARTITLTGFSATGGTTTLAPRTITLPGFSAAGPTNTTLASRAIDLAGFRASGMFTTLAPRTVELNGFTAAGLFASLAPRTLSLGGFTAAGTFAALPSRTITLDGFAAAGTFTTLPSRTITLTGWTVVGVNP